MHTRIKMFVALMTTNLEPTPTPVPQKHTLQDVFLAIPTLNEEDAIGELVREAQSVGFVQIIVIDGFSSDRTREIAENAGAKVLFQEFGKGKGCGIRTAMKEFLTGHSDLLGIIDGDGTNLPSDLARMGSIATEQGVDVVLGSRTRGHREKGAMPWLSLASNLTASFLLGARFGRYFSDIQTGSWILNRPAVERIYPQLRSGGFEIELELFVTSMKAGLRAREIPVAFRRRKGSTKFSFRMRIRNLYYVLRFIAS